MTALDEDGGRDSSRQLLTQAASGCFIDYDRRSGRRGQFRQVRRDNPAKRHEMTAQRSDSVFHDQRPAGRRGENRVQHHWNVLVIPQNRRGFRDAPVVPSIPIFTLLAAIAARIRAATKPGAYAATARRSARLRRPSTPPRAAGSVPACWR